MGDPVFNLQYQATFSGGEMAYLATIQDMEIVSVAGQTVLQTASGSLGGTTTFTIAEGTIAQFQAQAACPTISRLYSQVPYGGSTLLLSIVRLDNVIALADDGRPGGATGTPVSIHNSGFIGDQMTMLAVKFGPDTFVYASRYGDAGLAMYRVSAPAVLTPIGNLIDDSELFLGDVTAMASGRIGSRQFLFTASGAENGITCLEIGSDGRLSPISTVDQDSNLFVSGLSGLETATVGAETYLLATAAGSSSVSVVKISPTGQMQVVDQVMDASDSRFAGATVLKVVHAGGRVFVLVAGSDDGITLFTLLPGGRLMSLGSLEDSAAACLQNVSTISAVAFGSEIQVFATSGSEPGISQFRVDLAPIGLTIHAPATGGSIAGTALDDLLVGRAGGDAVFGGGGDDIILDGAGADLLTGGSGADTFLMTYDNIFDRVMDFQVGVDRLDLSAWPLLYSAAQITITSTATGAMLIFGEEALELVSDSQRPIAVGQLLTPDLLNLMRQFGLLDGPGLVLDGTAGSDLMIGAAGHDVFRGTAGGDWLSGGGGFDVVIFDRSSEKLVLDLIFSGRNRGNAQWDSFDSIERFCGSDGKDKLAGSAFANQLFGGPGGDILKGRSGEDLLVGESGRDIIAGGKGADTLTGGNGQDVFIFKRPKDSVTGLSGHDLITDFKPGADRLNLASLDANLLLAGNQAFHLVEGKAFTGQAGELRIVKDTARQMTRVDADLDGDRTADLRIELSGLTTLTPEDFFL